MDYPLHYSEESTSATANTSQSNPYRSYVFNDNSIMFNNSSSPTTVDNEDGTRSGLVMSRPTQLVLQDPWAQHHHHHHHHQLLNNNEFNSNDILHHQNLSHSERGIAGFVSKLYQCLQSTDTSQKYARWCQHDGKDMFIIDCIPEFTEVVLPRLFKHCKFPSFVRQLNIYGFQRDTDARKSKDTKDKESCRWYHPCFRPGRRDLFHLIRRKATRYSRKKRAKIEEDPETILNLGSADESEADDENAILIINQDDRRCSSSASSVTQSMHHPPIDYNTTQQSQLQLGFEQSLVENSVIPEEPIDEPEDNNNNPNNSLQLNLHSHQQSQQQQQQQQQQGSILKEDLRLELYQVKRQYERMHNHFEEQLSTAQIQIEEQQVRIRQLEGLLRLNKNPPNPVKLNSSGGGYMNTVCATLPSTFSGSNFIQSPNTRLLNQQQPSLYNLQKHTTNTTTTTTTKNDPSSSSSSVTAAAPTTNTTTTSSRLNEDYNQFYYTDKIKMESNNDTHHLLHTPPPPTNTSSPQQSTWTFHHRHDKNVSAGSNNHHDNTQHHHRQQQLLEHEKPTKSQHINFNSYNNNSF